MYAKNIQAAVTVGTPLNVMILRNLEIAGVVVPSLSEILQCGTRHGIFRFRDARSEKLDTPTPPPRV